MTIDRSDRTSRRTRTSGLVTILLAAIAMLLPLVDWAPRGGLVGWLLVLAGGAELTFGMARRPEPAGDAAMVGGLLTAAAGLVLVLDPLAGYFPVANVVMGWLLVRGAAILIMAWRVRAAAARAWLSFSGAVDLLLGIAVALGLSLSMLVLTLFGPTREIVAQFSLILAASFLATGIAQVMMAREIRLRGRAG